MSGMIIPAILGKGQRFPGFGPLPTPWSFNSALQLSWHLWMSFHLLIEDKGPVLSVILVPFDSNCCVLCPWTLSLFQKLCPAPFPPFTDICVYEHITFVTFVLL